MVSEDAITRVLLRSIIGNGITLYMLAILLCWTAPWLELDLRQGRLSFVGRICDPVLERLRKVLPAMGPMDWAPPVALMVLWVIRIMLVQY